jgi:hypothetical protein
MAIGVLCQGGSSLLPPFGCAHAFLRFSLPRFTPPVAPITKNRTKMPTRDQANPPGKSSFERQQPIGLFRDGGTKDNGGRCQEAETLLQAYENRARIEGIDPAWKEAAIVSFFSLFSWKK